MGDDFIVLKGLKVDEQIVTSCKLPDRLRHASQVTLGSFVPPPPSEGALSTTSASQGNVEFSSDPAIPRKGSNVFRVKLTDASGAHISGAEVGLMLLAMPAMGMALMRTPATSDKGNGLYEGSGKLEKRRNLASHDSRKRTANRSQTGQFSVNVTGGM